MSKTLIQRTSPVTSSPESAPARSSGGKTLLVLGSLLAVAIVARRFVHRHMSGSRTRRPDFVTPLGHQRIDDELTVRLLQVGPRLLVIGSTPNGLTTLADVHDPREIALLTGGDAAQLFSGHAPIDRPDQVEPAAAPVQRSDSRLPPRYLTAKGGVQ